MRTEKEWENRYQCVKRFMGVMDLLSEEFKNDQKILETCATMLRNPIIFDNNVKSNLIEYEYKIKLKNELQGVQLAEALKELKEVKDVRISFDDPNENQNN